MNIIGTVVSWNETTNKDCFGNGNPQTIDHIWPTDLNGSNDKENKQLLSETSNNKKDNNSQGKINDIRFSIQQITTKEQTSYGVMYITKESWGKNNWKKVIPIL